MQLSHQQKEEFVQRGLVKVPGVVPQVMVDAALTAINHALGEGIDPAQVPIFRALLHAPELQRAPVITDLINQTPALALAESLIGVGQIKPIGAGQIALRFPSQVDPPPPPRPHLDGMHAPNNGVPAGTIRNFTMLLGVALSEVRAPYSGNFTVWPGTHTIYEKWFRERGPEALLEGMPKVEIPEPEQQTASPGDVMLVHYQVAHAAAINVSPHVRYAIYFRLHHVDHERHGLDTLTNIWLEWDGVRDLVGQVGKLAQVP